MVLVFVLASVWLLLAAVAMLAMLANRVCGDSCGGPRCRSSGGCRWRCDVGEGGGCGGGDVIRGRSGVAVGGGVGGGFQDGYIEASEFTQ